MLSKIFQTEICVYKGDPKNLEFIYLFKDFIYLFLEKGREKERERNINV